MPQLTAADAREIQDMSSCKDAKEEMDRLFRLIVAAAQFGESSLCIESSQISDTMRLLEQQLDFHVYVVRAGKQKLWQIVWGFSHMERYCRRDIVVDDEKESV